MIKKLEPYKYKVKDGTERITQMVKRIAEKINSKMPKINVNMHFNENEIMQNNKDEQNEVVEAVKKIQSHIKKEQNKKLTKKLIYGAVRFISTIRYCNWYSIIRRQK